MNLPDYNPEARCPKCGYDLVKTRYVWSHIHPDFFTRARKMIALDPSTGKPLYEKPSIVPEHLERVCVRCSYTWSENVIGVREIDVRSEAE
jgi:hypothetical protein